jgi:hypothetical protein
MKRTLLILALIFPAISSAASTTVAKIDRILFTEGGGGFIYIYPEGGVTNPPACHGSNGDYISYSVSRPMAKEYISGLMAAMMAGRTVALRTLDECVDQSISVTLAYFSIYGSN